MREPGYTFPRPLPGWWESRCTEVEVREGSGLISPDIVMVAEAQGAGAGRHARGWVGRCQEGAKDSGWGQAAGSLLVFQVGVDLLRVY